MNVMNESNIIEFIIKIINKKRINKKLVSQYGKNINQKKIIMILSEYILYKKCEEKIKKQLYKNLIIVDKIWKNLLL